MIIGVDNGYTYTKASTGVIFPSIVSKTEEEMDINEGKLEVELNGQKYMVGDSAKLGDYTFTVDLNKTNHENTMICILTALAMSMKNSIEEFRVITGLPVGLYAKQKEGLKKKLIHRDYLKIKLNGIQKYLKISMADVFPQSAAIFYSVRANGESVLVIDIGGLTIDVCLFECIGGKYKLTKYRTYPQGTLKLYSKIIKKVNTEYEMDHKVLDAENIIRNGLYIYGQRQDCSFISDMIHSYVSDFINDMKLDFNIKTAGQAVLGGGGSILLQDYMKKHIPHAYLVPNAQFKNAEMFAEIGRVRFA